MIDCKCLKTALEKNGSEAWVPQEAAALLDRFAWLSAFAKILVPEYYLKWPQMQWWQRGEFREFLRKFPDLAAGYNNDRSWNLIQMLRLCQHVAGDAVECGCYKGASSWLILRQWQKEFMDGSRHLLIFDSFAGVSEPGEYDGSHWQRGSLCAGEKILKENLKEFGGAWTSHKGWIPDRFDVMANRKFAFAHIDVDLYEPTRDSIGFIYPRLNPGAVLICDDYGFTSCPGATKAVDEYLADKPEKMLSFASGGGWIIKGTPVAEAKANEG